jgi:hypothetical protein
MNLKSFIFCNVIMLFWLYFPLFSNFFFDNVIKLKIVSALVGPVIKQLF